MINKLITIRNKGFSLVELLVVISVIAILSGVLYTNISNARAAARDDIRKSDLTQLQLAIEMYRAQHGRYPAAGCSTNVNSFTATTCSNYIVGHAAGINFVPDFIPTLPRDPRTRNAYQYRSDGNSFKIISTEVEQKRVTSYNEEFARCPQAGGTNCPATPPANTYAVFRGINSASW